jgi:hypothetical protein
MKEIFFALRGENPNTFETAYMAYNGELLYRNYNELKEQKRLHLVYFIDYVCSDDVSVAEITSRLNEFCFKAKIKHPELNFYPQFFKGNAESVSADLTAEIEELGLTEEEELLKKIRSTWEDDIKLPCSFDKVCKNLISR